MPPGHSDDSCRRRPRSSQANARRRKRSFSRRRAHGCVPVTTTRELSLPRDGEVRLSQRGLRRAFRALGAPLVYAVLPALLLTVMVAASIHHHFAFDFHQFWQGGRDVIEGRSPYPPAHSLPTGGDPTLDAVAIQDTFRFPYPAPAAIAMAPFGASHSRSRQPSSSSFRSPPSSWRCVCSVSWTGGATGSSSRRSPRSAPSGWEPSRRSSCWDSPSPGGSGEKVDRCHCSRRPCSPEALSVAVTHLAGGFAARRERSPGGRDRNGDQPRQLGRDRLRRPCELPRVAVHSGLLGREQGLVGCCARPLARALVSRCTRAHARSRRLERSRSSQSRRVAGAISGLSRSP